MKRLVLILMVACLLALGGQSFAELCTIDAVPAATLLLPYFEVDISDGDGDGTADPGGVNTVFTIHNVAYQGQFAMDTLGLGAYLSYSYGKHSFELDGERYPLRLRRLPPVVDSRTRTRQARLEFTGAQAPAGSAGRLRWEAEVAYLPPSLLVRRAGGLGVFLIEDGKARFHPLPGATEGQPARVELPAATQLVLEGRQRLSDGDPVVLAPD